MFTFHIIFCFSCWQWLSLRHANLPPTTTSEVAPATRTHRISESPAVLSTWLTPKRTEHCSTRRISHLYGMLIWQAEIIVPALWSQVKCHLCIRQSSRRLYICQYAAFTLWWIDPTESRKSSHWKILLCMYLRGSCHAIDVCCLPTHAIRWRNSSVETCLQSFCIIPWCQHQEILCRQWSIQY